MATDHFAGWLAEGYDAVSADMYTPEVLGPTVDFLAARAGSGPVLELAIGTGRVALPLSERGFDVHGIDLSPDMVAQLRAKPGADAITVTMGDMATTRAPGRFTLVYVVFNSISNVMTQDEQVATVANAAAHLEPGGRFVVELWIPDLRRFPPGTKFQPFLSTDTHLGIDELDCATQLGASRHYFLDGEHMRVAITPFRWIWPSELDLMARLAGMTLSERFADWDGSPFTSDSAKHVSVWQKPAR